MKKAKGKTRMMGGKAVKGRTLMMSGKKVKGKKRGGKR